MKEIFKKLETEEKPKEGVKQPANRPEGLTGKRKKKIGKRMEG